MRLLRHITASDIELEEYKFERELSMEAYLIDNKKVLALDKEVFSEVTVVEDELTLKRARLKDISQPENRSDGRIDLLISYGDSNVDYIGVVELKLGELNATHLGQLEDYLGDDQKEQIRKLYPDLVNNDSDEPKWIGVLVGTSITKELEKTISEGYDFNGAPIAALVINRYRGGDMIYVTTDCYFKDNQTNSRDRTKYRFNDEVYTKGRLVHAVISQHVSKNPEIEFSILKKAFPNELQGNKNSGVFLTKERALDICKSTGYKRHFIKDEDFIMLGDSSIIAVSSQWGIGNITRFIEKAKELGHSIELYV